MHSGLSRSMGTTALFVLLLLGMASNARAQWQRVGSFPAPIGSGFFFDENVGLIGSGIRPVSYPNGTIVPGDEIFILKTTNGGATWTQSAVPQMYGAVTQIFMRDKLNGYASIFSDGFLGKPALWRTTDGGATWMQDLQLEGEATCVYATSKAIVWTDWDNPQYGGTHSWGASTSTDNGLTWTNQFRERGNGIDFTDDNVGVVTQMNPTKNTFWYTNDGGITWSESDPNEMEAWSVYGVKGTKTFFTSNESQGGQPHTMVNWSTDGGATWSVRHDFGYPMSFTGTIAGKGSTVYLQTDQGALGNLGFYGLYRSDDLGNKWKPVGGPRNNRDTRFVVTGCSGQVVYAFDDQGGVFKTMNGGDGTLRDGNPRDAILGLDRDTIILHATRCVDSAIFHIFSDACAVVHVDSIAYNATNELRLDSSAFGKVLHLGDSASILIHYTPSDTGERIVNLAVIMHVSDSIFTKRVTLVLRSDIPEQLFCSKDTLRLSQIGCTTTPDSVTLVSASCSDLVIDSVSFTDSSFSIADAPPLSAPSGGVIPFRVRYTSDTNGTHVARMRLRGHIGDHMIDTTIQVFGTTELPKLSLVLDKDTLSYGTRYCVPLQDTLRLLNSSCLDLTIDSITTSGPFSTNYRARVLAGGQRDTLWALFTPQDSGLATGTLVIHAHSSTDTLSETVTLTGENFTTRNAITLDQTALHFPTSGCIAVTDSLTLYDECCNRFEIDSIVSLTSEFAIISQVPASILSGDSLGIQVRFTPDSGGICTGRLRVYGKLGGTLVDTIINVAASNSLAPIPLQFSTDSVSLVTDYCQPILEPLTLRNNLCTELQLDSMRIIGDSLNEFSCDTTGFGTIRAQFGSGCTIRFTPQDRGTRTAQLRLFFHSGLKTFDTSLSITGKNITAPEPYLADMPSVEAGDTLVLRMMLRPTQDTFSMKHIAFHLRYDTDLLLPLDLFTTGTLATSINNFKMTPTSGGVSVNLDLSDPITQHSDLSQPLLELRMTPYIARHLSTSVVIDTFATDVTATEPLCSLPSSEFTLKLRCGDSTIYDQLAGQPIGLEIISIHPNPSHGGDETHLTYRLAHDTPGLLADLFDLDGKQVAHVEINETTAGTHSVVLPINVTTGRFELVLRAPGVGASARPFLIEH